jgi:starch phosphorylase
LFQFLFGAKVHEVAELREKGGALKVPLQFARVLRYENMFFIFKERISGLLTNADKISDHYLVVEGLKLSIYLV